MTWFGSVPAHWSTPPVYARYEVQLGKMLDERQITKRFLAPYLRNTDVQWDGINVDDLPEMDFDESEQKLYALRPGDILVCEGGEIGRCAIWDSDKRCFYQKALHRLRPTTDKDDPRYFVLVMRAAVEAGLFSSRASAATIQHLPAEKLRVVRYPAPPIEEQRALVDRVSRQTARLDALVVAKQRLLDLLAEKRKTIIATAVTRGLDPKVKLRDSGVPWLGEMPAHWSLVPLRYLLNLGPKNGISPQQAGADGVLSFSISAVRDGRVTIRGNEKYVALARSVASSYYLKSGDILLVRGNGNLSLVGTCGLLEIAPDECTYPDILMLMRVGERVIAELLVAAINSPYVRQQIESLAQTTNGTYKLSGEDVRTLQIALPPEQEQHAIVGHIARETAKLDAVRAATERTIALLNERRSALIAAAVNGQLDVGAAA